jgi:phosphoenolpyruvate carboxylase
MHAVGGQSPAYREFVDREHFVDYFRAATPIDVIEQMTLGSRPAQSPQHARRAGSACDSVGFRVDAVPFDHHRLVRSGHGAGTGAAKFGEKALQEMARDWPFFSNMLDDVEMVLAKCDLDIAEAFSKAGRTVARHILRDD